MNKFNSLYPKYGLLNNRGFLVFQRLFNLWSLCLFIQNQCTTKALDWRDRTGLCDGSGRGGFASQMRGNSGTDGARQLAIGRRMALFLVLYIGS
jgi:hypothetical protein